MRIVVIDGQGGGIGKLLVEHLRRHIPAEEAEIVVLGTNAVATAVMLKAGANDGATGENAVVQTVAGADVIVGTLSAIIAHGMMGEITPAMAEAIARSPAPKVLLHLNRAGIEIIGASTEPLPHLADMLARQVKTHLDKRSGSIGRLVPGFA
ncbi:MAG: DUF3842 family protein [Desulfotomaculales bacterium]